MPCPSAADPDRNPHRAGNGWRLRTVAAVLANPRYTGRQVWNRHRTDHEQTQDELPGLLQARRLNAGIQWAVSAKPTHPALVSVHDFVAAQAVKALAQPRDGTKRTYLLAGLLRCGLCGRSLESQWSHGNPCYRCRHGHTSAHNPSTRPAVNLHLREESSSPAPSPSSTKSAALIPRSDWNSHTFGEPTDRSNSPDSCATTRSRSSATSRASLWNSTRQRS